MTEQHTQSRRKFISTTASAVAALTIVPRHVLGGPRFVALSDKVNVAIIGAGGQGRTNARALFQEKDCQVIAVADPAQQWDLSAFYFGGEAGRGPVRAEIEKTYAERLREAADPQHPGGAPRGPGGEGNRRGHADGQPGPLGRGAP